MLFNSAAFVLFFLVVTPTYFALSLRGRWWLLLVASCVFYMAFVPAYIFILLFTIAVDYGAGLFIERTSGWRRKGALIGSIVANVGVLAMFKYAAFAVSSINFVMGRGAVAPAWLSEVVLPIGLSFHTFQAMSYTIEVYRGNQRAERDPLLYALYVMYYPQLVAGPIERPQNLLPQFRAMSRFSAEDATEGLRLVLRGFVKKVVIADRLSSFVDAMYRDPRGSSGLGLGIATVFFAFQIYADFSGYSDIALGCSRFMGVRLMQNFRQPYFATSISEFWRRWHVSLSTWFRDYVYFPLGGNRGSAGVRARNLMVTFVLSGLWHGANWTFVIWGALNGLFLVIGAQRRRATAATLLARVGGITTTFLLVCVTWVFFRARTVGDALVALHRIAVLADGRGLSRVDVVRGALVIVLLVCIDLAESQSANLGWLRSRPAWQRWTVYYAASALVIFAGCFGDQQFIYFQF